MKCVVLCALFLGVAMAVPQNYPYPPNGCIYVNGRCTTPCPAGTHAYTTGCNYLMPQATCQVPKPVLDTRGKICDYSSCYCDEPTVRDEKTNLCVTVDKCCSSSEAEMSGVERSCANINQ